MLYDTQLYSMICDAKSIKIDSSFKYNVLFGASGAHSLFCVLFINCFKGGGNFAKEKGGEGSLCNQDLKE